MIAFRIFLGFILLILIGYTAVVIANHGWNLLAVFFGDIARMAWPGQFNLDFLFMLALSALWVGWRHRFSRAGVGLAVLAFFGGALFLSAYLLVQTFRTGGDIRSLVSGTAADQASDKSA